MKHLRLSILSIFLVFSLWLLGRGLPVLAQGYGTQTCLNNTAAQLNVKKSNVEFSGCYQDAAVCGAKGGTVIAAGGCNNNDVCCGKAHDANFVSCADYVKQLVGAANVKTTSCYGNVTGCGSKETDFGVGHCTGSDHCCADVNAGALKNCQEAAGVGTDAAVLTAGCTPNAEKCTSTGNGKVVPGITDCTPGICCLTPARAPGTCAQVGEIWKGKQVETVCAGELDCPTGYIQAEPRLAGMKSISDCAAPKLCCVKTDAATTKAGEKGASPPLIDPLGGASFFDTIRRVIKVFLGMVGALVFAVFVYSGVTWMTAGSSERVQTAKNAIKYAVIGLIIIGFSFAITNFIVDAFANQGSFGSPQTTEPEPATPQELQP